MSRTTVRHDRKSAKKSRERRLDAEVNLNV